MEFVAIATIVESIEFQYPFGEWPIQNHFATIVIQYIVYWNVEFWYDV
jgi:hypothetical protein